VDEVSVPPSVSECVGASLEPDTINGSREPEEMTMAEQSKPQTGPSTASQISLEEFIEVATRAAIRAVASQGAEGIVAALNPQPLPPGAAIRAGGRVITGIVYEPE
jgi:hypothetical protein